MSKVTANGIQIEYETFGESSGRPLLLIIGLGGQLIFWDDVLCRDLAGRGHYVIRFDNRDAGLSTKFDEAGVPDLVETFGKIMQSIIWRELGGSNKYCRTEMTSLDGSPDDTAFPVKEISIPEILTIPLQYPITIQPIQ